jgi:glycosyltransferase involved in cell wall biosynthesis
MHPLRVRRSIGRPELRLAVISPFIDRQHGTERAIAESLERFAQIPGAEIHLYSQRVEDLPSLVSHKNAAPGKIIWHRVPAMPGPHLTGFIWWFFANFAQRAWDTRVRGLHYDLLYSPGINCFDADAISVHVVFGEFYRRVKPKMVFRQTPFSGWALLVHRHLYYRLICFLERMVYTRKKVALAAISQHAADTLSALYKRDDIRVIRYGVDTSTFSPHGRIARRDSQRNTLQLAGSDFCALLIGNDWKNKGLVTLLNAAHECPEWPLVVLVVGSDDPREYLELAGKLAVTVRFLPPSRHVMQFYAAADVYVGPSLEDAYGLPILEAMACGLPVVASARAGASEIIRDRENGFVLQDPEDARQLAELLRQLCSDLQLRQRLGDAAARTAQENSWDQNARDTWDLLIAVHERKLQTAAPDKQA